ncbi:hypothetical protein PIROE2DRAFT_6764, partial [Piromyces sp. E2]
LRHFSNDLTVILHEFINEPENYLLEFKYQLLNDLIIDINYAIEEINFFIFKGKSFVYYTNSAKDLTNYKDLVYAYLRLLNHLSFLGYQKDIMNEDEIETVIKVVKLCIKKLYSYQFNINNNDNFVKNGNTECENNGKNNIENNNNNGGDNNSNNNISKVRSKREDSDISTSPIANQFDLYQYTNDYENESSKSIINIEEINMNIINKERNEINIPESLRIPLTAIINKTDTIISALDHCHILKNKNT